VGGGGGGGGEDSTSVECLLSLPPPAMTYTSEPAGSPRDISVPPVRSEASEMQPTCM